MKTSDPISEQNQINGHICQCDSNKTSAISEKDESSSGCGAEVIHMKGIS